MAIAAKNQLEYLKLKVFLYKYTPEFIPDGEVDTGLLRIPKFSVELDENKYFHKYDITNYVASYSFDQDLYGNTFSWAVNLHDVILTPDIFNTVLQADFKNPPVLNTQSKIPSSLPRTTTPNLGGTGMTNLSSYEVSSNDQRTDDAFQISPTDIVVTSKLNRGHSEASLTEKASGTSAVIAGLRLSDLIQPYDMVSVYLYKETTPLEDLRGFKTLFVNQPFQAFRFVVDENGSESLSPEDLQKESILQSPVDGYTGKTLFSNEFNGFVVTKSVSRRVGAVDTVSIQGSGISRLLGATRRVLKSSLFEPIIYSPLETKDLSAITALQSIFAGKTVEEIVIDLFKFVYNIGFDVTTSSESVTGTSEDVSLTGAEKIVKTVIVNGSFYDVTKMQVGNLRQVNRLNLSPFLLALVMKRKLFNFRETSSAGNLSNNLAELDDLIVTPGLEDDVLGAARSLQNIYENGTDPILFDGSINDLRAYFRFIADVFEFFNPETKTPFEILDEVKKVTFAEIFETPEGVITIRNPQYNDTQNVIFSSDLDIVDTTYTSTTDNLLSKMKVGYGHDVIGKILQGIEYAFTDGKYLIQYGFMESATDINPNVKNDSSKDDQVMRDRDGIIFRYAEFFLRAHNAKLHTGFVSCNADPRVQVGKTFFDEKNNKFGYIVGVSKQIAVGQGATMTIQLSFVRDAYNALPGEKQSTALRFEQIPTLADIGSN